MKCLWNYFVLFQKPQKPKEIFPIKHQGHHWGCSRQCGENNLLWVNQRHEGQLLIVFCIWSGQLHYIVFEECLDRSVLPELSQVPGWTRSRGYRGQGKHCDSQHCSISISHLSEEQEYPEESSRRSSRTVDAPLTATVTTIVNKRWQQSRNWDCQWLTSENSDWTNFRRPKLYSACASTSTIVK